MDNSLKRGMPAKAERFRADASPKTAAILNKDFAPGNGEVRNPIRVKDNRQSAGMFREETEK
jgi:hypothetical protein